MLFLTATAHVHAHNQFASGLGGDSFTRSSSHVPRCQLCSTPALKRGFRVQSPPSSRSALRVVRTADEVAAEQPQDIAVSANEVTATTGAKDNSSDEVDETREQTTGVIVKFLASKSWATAIIGKGGSSVKTIRQQSGAFIQLSSRDAFYPGTQSRVLVLRGELPQIESSLLSVLEIKDTLPLQQAEPSETTNVGMLLPMQVCGVLLGPQASTLTRVKAESGCEIVLTSRDKQILNVPDRSVWLTGTKQQIVSAVSLILTLLTTESNYNEVVQQVTPYATQQLTLTDKAAGVVIGKAGETIAQLQAVTGVKMVLSARKEGELRVLSISGNPKSVKLAASLVLDKVRTVNPKFILPRGYRSASDKQQQTADGIEDATEVAAD